MHIEVDVGGNIVIVADVVLNVTDLSFCVLVNSVCNAPDDVLFKLLWLDSPHYGTVELSSGEILLVSGFVGGVCLACEEFSQRVHDILLLLAFILFHPHLQCCPFLVVDGLDIFVFLFFHVVDKTVEVGDLCLLCLVTFLNGYSLGLELFNLCIGLFLLGGSLHLV